MPIHDQGYRRYGGLKAAVGQGWVVIARAGIRTMFAKRAFLGLLLAAWLPFLGRAGQFYFAANLPQAQMLALSSLSNSSRYVGIMFAAVIFFSSAVYRVLYVVTRSTSLSWISFTANLSQVGNVIFRLPLKYDTPWPVSLFMIVAIVVLSGFILERRVRGVEVVA